MGVIVRYAGHDRGESGVRMNGRIILLPLLGLATSGCIARTAVDIVTLPVRAVGAGVDAVTTSQEEADRNRGREMRKAEERERREERRRAREERERWEDERDD